MTLGVYGDYSEKFANGGYLYVEASGWWSESPIVTEAFGNRAIAYETDLELNEFTIRASANVDEETVLEWLPFLKVKLYAGDYDIYVGEVVPTKVKLLCQEDDTGDFIYEVTEFREA